MIYKIRAWDKQKNRMAGQQWLVPGDRLEVLRLSGARDKNGTDIGEKDIVTFRGNKYLANYNKEMLRWVITTFIVDDFGNREYGLEARFNSEMAKEMEVIGNILREDASAGKTE
jgi:hypothetical protein